MKSSLVLIILAISVFAGSVLAQNGTTKPRAILVDIVSGKSNVQAVPRPRTLPAPKIAVSSASDVEARTFELMNAQRLVNGLKILKWDEKLAAVARLHSRNMASGHFFSHKGQSGEFVDDRAAQLGIYNWLAIGENIAFMKGYADPATMAVEQWMKSPSHKKNILNDQWRESAIGVGVADDGSIYLTQVFITR